jgi:uncharacterized protein YecE (DUF72 family)
LLLPSRFRDNPSHANCRPNSTWHQRFHRRQLARHFLSRRCAAEGFPFYATRLHTVEVDSTYHRTPSVSTVEGWAARTPDDFIFALKVPQVITHEKVLVDSEEDFENFAEVADNLGKKLGPMFLQFPYFNKAKFKALPEFLARLKPFLKLLPKKKQFALEIRNKSWLVPAFVDLLRENNVALALIEQAWMPPIDQWFTKFDPITTDFTYIRWLGDRKGIEQHTKAWDKTIVDRSKEMQVWVKYCRQITRKGVKVYAYANNLFAGHGSAAVALFQKLWEKHSA